MLEQPPEILQRLEQQLLDKGYNPSSVTDKARQYLINAGVLDEDGKLTEKGKERNDDDNRENRRNVVTQDAGNHRDESNNRDGTENNRDRGEHSRCDS